VLYNCLIFTPSSFYSLYFFYSPITVEEFTTAEQKSKALLAAEAKENFATLSPEQLEKWIAARKHVAS
jgi:hypothetical protein